MSEEIIDKYKTLKELQQENKQLKEENARLKEWKEDLLNENITLENIRKEAIEYNKNILKESWYGGNEKEYAKTNLEILGDKENE